MASSRRVFKNKKRCFLFDCTNDLSRTPEKSFFCIPSSNVSEWCQAAGYKQAPNRTLYICEDHLNLQEDVENYCYWKLMPNVPAKLKSRLPTALIHSSNQTPLSTIDDTFVQVQPSRLSLINSDTVNKRDQSSMCAPQMHEKKVQVKPSTSDQKTNTSKRSAENMECVEDLSSEEDLSPSLKGQTDYDITERESTSSSQIEQKEEKRGRKFMLEVIAKKPQYYIGIPKNFYWVVELIAQEHQINPEHIIITLYKIRNNDTLAKLSDIFQKSQNTVRKIFYKNFLFLSQYFQQFIYWPTASQIKKNLPTCFKTNKEFANVQAIIDCFEIEIEKPKNPIHQALTWSQYKSCNTIKYLISATPDGLINCISAGFGGRISDVNLVEQSGFTDLIPQNAVILADRGFKHLEATLRQKNIKILRPPSVSSNVKCTKPEVITSKIIASLRVHIERVIRRVRLFRLLKPHSVVNSKLVAHLGEAVVVACGLINLQPPIMKPE